MTRIAIIADDLTGALDTASPFACRGLKTEVALDVDSLAGIAESNAEVLGVSTNSRYLPAEEAGRAAAKAAGIMKAWNPDLVLKKIDSRLKGNIAVETEAIADVFQVSSIVAAPAVPDQGRHVRDGKVTGFGVDEPLEIAGMLGSLAMPVSIPDASTPDDLERIAAEWNRSPQTLYVCARGLAVAFARIFGRGDAGTPFSIEDPVVVAIGSRDPVTERQADLLCRDKSFLRIPAPNGLIPPKISPAARTVYQCTGDPREPMQTVARRFAHGLAAAIALAKPRTLLLSGGDTALAVLRELGIAGFEICGEAAPGLPWFVIPLKNGLNMSAISKSGGFGDESILTHIFSRLPSSMELLLEPKARYGSH